MRWLLPATNRLRRKGRITLFMSMPILQPRRISGAVWFFSCVALSLVGALWLSRPAMAQSGITSPAPGASVSGDVQIVGTAVIDPFQKYELHYKMEPSGDDAYIYFFGGTTPVMNGVLGTWQAGGLPAGVYSLRLRVVKNDGNYAEFYTPDISVNQTGGAATPTIDPSLTMTPTAEPTSSEPTPTPIPTATFTPAPQPTVAVGQVAQPVADTPPTPTLTPAAVGVISPSVDANGQPLTTTLSAITGSNDSDAGGNVTRELGEALSLNRLRSQFFNGMRISAALFLGVISLYAGKRLFDWVWTQFS